jgi:alkyldihydroxyacetonephosphate synthase
VIAKGKDGQQLQQWDTIKKAVSNKIIELGGTITHHHSVGKDHRPYYEKQRSAPFGDVLTNIKKTFDPNWILNPDVLIRSDE